MNTEIVCIPRERQAEAAAVLVEAFAADTQFSKFFPRIDGSYRESVAALFSWACELHSKFAMPFIAAIEDGQVIGVATVLEPYRYKRPLAPVLAWRVLRGGVMRWRVGLTASRRMQRYSRAAATLRPTPPYHYVSNIGVLGRAQGEGLRDRILDAAYELACGHPSSNGLVLDTFNPQFARALESRGWSVSGPKACGPMAAFSLFRCRPGLPGGPESHHSHTTLDPGQKEEAPGTVAIPRASSGSGGGATHFRTDLAGGGGDGCSRGVMAPARY
jgi:hypothetical protein